MLSSFSIKPLIDDDIMHRIIDALSGWTAPLLNAATERLLVRYHSDADGISGALSIKRALEGYNVVFIQNNSPFYEVSSALSDILLFNRNPAILLIDFGSNKESEEALRILKSNKFRIFHIDHHPPNFDHSFEDMYINPWLFGGESFYTAGMIAGELARLLGYVNAIELEKVSLAGDKSIFFKEEWKEAKDKALVLDYLSSTIENKRRCIDIYNKTLKNKEMFEIILLQAKESIDDIRVAIKGMEPKESKRGFRFLIVDLSQLLSGKKYPGRGTATGIIFDKFKKDGPLVVIGYLDGIFSIRANEDAIKIGFSANNEINGLKKEYGNLILSGGGHKCAASLRTSKENEKLMVSILSKRFLGF